MVSELSSLLVYLYLTYLVFAFVCWVTKTTLNLFYKLNRKILQNQSSTLELVKGDSTGLTTFDINAPIFRSLSLESVAC